jgi:hypothetical protein
MDPITIAAGIAAVGSLFKGITGLFGGNAKAKAEKAAAAQAGQEAGVNAQAALAEGDAAAAQGAVQAAANGGGFVGSSIAAIQNLSNIAMFKARAAAYRGQTEIQNHLYGARVAKAQGVNSLIGGVIGAAGALAGGLAGGAPGAIAGSSNLAASPAPELAGLY